jgi:hypothetical protein
MDNWKEKYDDVGSFQEGRAWVKLNRKYGFVDLQGNEVIPPKYDDVFSFYEGRARVRLNGKEYFKPQDRAKLRENKIQQLLKDL